MLRDKILALRSEKGVTQTELADAIGVSRQTVRRWESGESEPSGSTILPLSKYFGVSPNELLEGEITMEGKAKLDVDEQRAIKRQKTIWTVTKIAVFTVLSGLFIYFLAYYRATDLGNVFNMCRAYVTLGLLVFFVIIATIVDRKKKHLALTKVEKRDLEWKIIKVSVYVFFIYLIAYFTVKMLGNGMLGTEYFNQYLMYFIFSVVGFFIFAIRMAKFDHDRNRKE